MDASVALSWLLDDEDTQGTDVLAQAVGGELLLVPAHWWAEVSNALVVAVRRKRAEIAQALNLLNSLKRLQIQVGNASPDFYSSVLLSAADFNLTAYDAAYLVLAQRYGVPLVTGDKQLRQAALAAGVALIF